MIRGGVSTMKSDPKRRRIALFGTFGTGNLGNEATLQAMVYNLRSHLPDVEITCICPEPENTASEHNISAIPMRAPFPIWKLGVSSKHNKPAEDSRRNVSKTAAESRRWSKAFIRLRPLRMCAYLLLETYRWFKGFA